MKKRKRVGKECSEVFTLLCTECRQLFFEKMNSIDNDSALVSEIQLLSESQGNTYYNQKVIWTSGWLRGIGRINEFEMQDIVQCMSLNSNSLKIA